jgi:hypothetical protein
MSADAIEVPVRPPSPAAKRMRRFRRRQHYGMQSVRIQLSLGDISVLIERGYLDPNRSEDLTVVGQAAGAFISDALGNLL